MSTVIVTGSGGLIGSESVRHFVEAGYDVVGIENDMRAQFFGASASTSPITERLRESYPLNFRSLDLDIRDAEGVDRVFAEVAAELELVVHTAAQPSHDWAASAPQVDFTVNANGTLNLLEATRLRKPEATFVFTSTNKVYGDRPNFLPLVEQETRLELPRRPRVPRRHPRDDVDRPHAALAVRRLEGRRRRAGPGVRALLRHADRVLPRRLPDRAGAPRRAAARLPRLPDALHRYRRAVHDLRLRRQAGARQHPRRRRRQRVRGVPQGAAQRRRLQPRRRARERDLDARGDRRLRAHLRPHARLLAVRPGAHRRPSLVDLRPRRVPRRLPRVGHRVRPRAHADRDPRGQRGGRGRGHEAVGRHPGAQRGGLDRARRSTASAPR